MERFYLWAAVVLFVLGALIGVAGKLRSPNTELPAVKANQRIVSVPTANQNSDPRFIVRVCRALPTKVPTCDSIFTSTRGK